MSINLSIQFSHPSAISNQVSYARIDNTSTPVFIQVPNVITSPATIASNVPDGQYQINITPVYADGRTCQPTTFTTPACSSLVSLSASINSSVMVINYLAPSGVPKVRITIGYPNGGNNTANYVNDGNPISVAIPANLFGDYTVSGQSVCDETSGFYSPATQNVTVTLNQPIPNQYVLSNNLTSICTGTPQQLYTSGGFSVGTTLFTDSTLGTPVTGFNYVMINALVYNIDSTTGLIGSATGNNCNVNITGNTTLSTGLPNSSGVITAPPGSTVNGSITANGPTGDTYTLQISIPALSITQTATNGTVTFSFVMPGSGSVNWSGLYTSSNSSGSGTFSVS